MRASPSLLLLSCLLSPCSVVVTAATSAYFVSLLVLFAGVTVYIYPLLGAAGRRRYNIGQVAIGIGDLGLAFQAFKIAVSINSHHAESFNNLGVLELRKGNVDLARSNFTTALQIAPFMFEPYFNAGACVWCTHTSGSLAHSAAPSLASVVGLLCECPFTELHLVLPHSRDADESVCVSLSAALLAYKLGDFQESFELVEKALAAFPAHSDSLDLMKQLRQHFTML